MDQCLQRDAQRLNSWTFVKIFFPVIEFCPRKNSCYFKLFCTHAAITALKWVEATCFGRNTQQVVRHRDLWQQLVKNPGVPRPFTLFLLWTFVDVHLKMWLPRGFRNRKGNWTWTKLCETNQGLGSGASEAISGCRKVGNCSVVLKKKSKKRLFALSDLELR